MIFKRYYLGCLAHASYLIGSAGEAVIVDPQRDVDQYIDDAKAAGLTIKGIVETHFHADFVSGHTELAERTGATIYLHESAKPNFKATGLADGATVTIGDATITWLHTPGHTPESSCVLVKDGADADAPGKLLTGDTLFIGEVGRPDLVGSVGFTPEAMAATMYDSLHQKILTLPDETEVFPAHGAGSACGRNIRADQDSSTVGEQRRDNYALQPMSQGEFVKLITERLPPPPAYFSNAVALNRDGPRSLEDVGADVPALTPEQLEAAAANHAVVLDVRPTDAYGAGHVPGSISIGLTGNFGPWSGTLVPPGSQVALVADTDAEVEEAVMRLARIGYESVVGRLDSGIEGWKAAGREVGTLSQLAVAALAGEREQWQLLDVRTPSEFEAGHVDEAINVPLNELAQRWREVEFDRPTAVMCRTGYRSTVACSMLEARGVGALTNVAGGFVAWADSGAPVIA